ncbi:hypothetical protein [Rhodococcoides fascians]|uniref:hypothetical protein n=1 Tax=Rhodococcoides fascians TaxID=1828 RepID=UPI0012D2CB7A|nr:hypothetical protein [Rhodococcus fascians]
MSDSTVPTEHYISTVKAMVTLVNKVDELEGQLRDYEDAFEQLAKDAHNTENALSWLSEQSIKRGLEDVAAGRVVSVDLHLEDEDGPLADWEKDMLAQEDQPVPYTIAEPAPDFSNTAEEPATYSLAEAAAILSRQGIDTGQNKLKKFLNTGICWTDAFGTPRGIAGDYLVETEPANPSRDAVVRITPEGVNELERVLNVAV